MALDVLVGGANLDSSGNVKVNIPSIVLAINLASVGAIQKFTSNGLIGFGVQLLSLGTGGTVIFEGSGDNVNFLPINGIPNPSGVPVSSTSTAGAWQFDGSAVPYFQVRCTALTSGAITGTMIATANSGVTMLEQGTQNTGTTGSEQALVVRNIPQSSTLTISSTAAANTGLTVTLPSAGAGLFHYITGIEITRNATAALAGTATLVITTTNLAGSRAWSVGNAMVAGGTQVDVNITRTAPIKSSVANTATTIVMPVPGAAVLWRCNVDYFVGP